MNYYVGAGGDDTALGTSWATRLLTLNAAEDSHSGANAKSAIAAGDTVYVGPGVYRETLTCDVSGSAGNPISYFADVSGAHTDGVGGAVRISGGNSSEVATRSYAISSSSKIYRNFTGFLVDLCTSYGINAVSPTHWNITDCLFGITSGSPEVYISGSGQGTCTINRCIFASGCLNYLYFQNSTTVDNAGHVVTNCLFLGGQRGVLTDRVGGILINQSTFRFQIGYSVAVNTAITAGQAITVNNCILEGSSCAFKGLSLGDIVEDYNNVFGNTTARTTCNTGAHSTTYASLFDMPILSGGMSFPWDMKALSIWSPLRGIAGTSMLSEDLYGLSRPATDSKKSWGAVQYQGQQRSAAQAQAGTYSLNLPDAGIVQFLVPASAVPTTISVQVYHEANYAGTLPQMIIRQPGQADTVITDTGAAGGWNLLTSTLTPAVAPGYVTVLLVSNNTATSGSYNTYFDGLAVN